MIRSLVLMQSAVAVVALAQQAPVAVVAERAPALSATTRLECPAGTRQVGGPRSALATMGCQKDSIDGMRVLDGPFIAFDAEGRVATVGTMQDGWRQGGWKFFDGSGAQTDLIEFSRGDYHGRWVKFDAQGKVRAEENWVQGKRQGIQKVYSAGGVTQTEYRDDKPVATR